VSRRSARYPASRWVSFVLGTPVNYQDPTGYKPRSRGGRLPCSVGPDGGGFFSLNVKARVDEAERYMDNTYDPMNTYVAAGIAIQCAGGDIPRNPFDADNSGTGIAQITENEAETGLGYPIYMYDENGQVKYKNGAPAVRSYGLRCLCDEQPLDPDHPNDAVTLMRRRIELVTSECKTAAGKCRDTDIYIAAALAQNGSGFTYDKMQGMKDKYWSEYNDPPVEKNWYNYFKWNNAQDTKVQLRRFNLVINELKSRGWYVPRINLAFIEYLKNMDK
jgi:hypothetical protein